MSGPSYILMTYARCGGTYLSRILGQTGCLGQPEDWFNGQGFRNLREQDYPLTRSGQLAVACERGTSANGVRGLKLSPDRIDALGGFDWHAAWKPDLFIHLYREDRLARAVSEAIAYQTRQYRSTSPAVREPYYDRALIARLLGRHAAHEARVQQYFAMHAISPLTLSYEALAADPQGAVDTVARALGIENVPRVNPAKIDLKVQRSSRNLDWARRFVAATGSPEILPPLAPDRPPGLLGLAAATARAVFNRGS